MPHHAGRRWWLRAVCCNAQAVVDTETMPALAPQAANDKQQLAPMLEQLQALTEEINQTEQLLADAGYFSETNVTACESAGIEPMVAIKRDEHHPPLVGALHEPRSPARRGDPDGAHDPPAEDSQGPGDLGPAQANRRAGLRHHQIRDGISSVPHPRSGQCSERVAPVCLAWNLKRMAALRLQ
ncbi:MAG: hypothetical protein EOM91_20875 [Sphingobacteriia bacterium]|nr:hypothetical protein [Sphingobacteriia bacterium]